MKNEFKFAKFDGDREKKQAKTYPSLQEINFLSKK